MANTLSSVHRLETRIAELEKVQARQTADLKLSAADIIDSISPAKLAKNVLNDIVMSPGLRSTAINTAIGIGAGILGKKLYVGGSRNLLRKITAPVVQFLIANFVSRKIPEMQENNLQHDHES